MWMWMEGKKRQHVCVCVIYIEHKVNKKSFFLLVRIEAISFRFRFNFTYKVPSNQLKFTRHFRTLKSIFQPEGHKLVWRWYETSLEVALELWRVVVAIFFMLRHTWMVKHYQNHTRHAVHGIAKKFLRHTAHRLTITSLGYYLAA